MSVRSLERICKCKCLNLPIWPAPRTPSVLIPWVTDILDDEMEEGSKAWAVSLMTIMHPHIHVHWWSGRLIKEGKNTRRDASTRVTLLPPSCLLKMRSDNLWLLLHQFLHPQVAVSLHKHPDTLYLESTKNAVQSHHWYCESRRPSIRHQQWRQYYVPMALSRRN